MAPVRSSWAPTNADREYIAQARPSSGTADRKQSYPITLPRKAILWPTSAALADFKATMLAFERRSGVVSMKVMSCFADALRVDTDCLTDARDPTVPEYQSPLRPIHHLGMETANRLPSNLHRAASNGAVGTKRRGIQCRRSAGQEVGQKLGRGRRGAEADVLVSRREPEVGPGG